MEEECDDVEKVTTPKKRKVSHVFLRFVTAYVVAFFFFLCVCVCVWVHIFFLTNQYPNIISGVNEDQHILYTCLSLWQT